MWGRRSGADSPFRMAFDKGTPYVAVWQRGLLHAVNTKSAKREPNRIIERQSG